MARSHHQPAGFSSQPAAPAQRRPRRLPSDPREHCTADGNVRPRSRTQRLHDQTITRRRSAGRPAGVVGSPARPYPCRPRLHRCRAVTAVTRSRSAARRRRPRGTPEGPLNRRLRDGKLKPLAAVRTQPPAHAPAPFPSSLSCFSPITTTHQLRCAPTTFTALYRSLTITFATPTVPQSNSPPTASYRHGTLAQGGATLGGANLRLAPPHPVGVGSSLLLPRRGRARAHHFAPDEAGFGALLQRHRQGCGGSDGRPPKSRRRVGGVLHRRRHPRPTLDRCRGPRQALATNRVEYR